MSLFLAQRVVGDDESFVDAQRSFQNAHRQDIFPLPIGREGGGFTSAVAGAWTVSVCLVSTAS